MQTSALYLGRVTHQRTRPVTHRFGYRVFWLLLDLADIDGANRRLRLFSRNRFNLLSFHDRDHGDGSDETLRRQITVWLDRAGIDIGDGPIRLLTMPRVLGYVFNPISFYFCHRPDGRLAAMVYEVTNTFGRRHSYVVPIRPEDQAAGLIRQKAAKDLYVSPFMGMDMNYEFRGRAPQERLNLTVRGLAANGLLITAAMSARRRPLQDTELLSAVLFLPFMTLKVMAAIHWEALKLWFRGVPLTRQPPPAREPVTIQPAAPRVRTASGAAR
ncbi:DUF1365 family protein [Phenylobacterium sp. LjRoot164]|uniref:DUF1365 domain-containing protein n=1 Tax=unclassified Phenylobacterium TaxID=2640670 RepID=UPI003ECE1E27